MEAALWERRKPRTETCRCQTNRWSGVLDFAAYTAPTEIKSGAAVLLPLPLWERMPEEPAPECLSRGQERGRERSERAFAKVKSRPLSLLRCAKRSLSHKGRGWSTWKRRPRCELLIRTSPTRAGHEASRPVRPACAVLLGRDGGRRIRTDRHDPDFLLPLQSNDLRIRVHVSGLWRTATGVGWLPGSYIGLPGRYRVAASWVDCTGSAHHGAHLCIQRSDVATSMCEGLQPRRFTCFQYRG